MGRLLGSVGEQRAELMRRNEVSAVKGISGMMAKQIKACQDEFSEELSSRQKEFEQQVKDLTLELQRQR